jgi:hypothetical protein
MAQMKTQALVAYLQSRGFSLEVTAQAIGLPGTVLAAEHVNAHTLSGAARLLGMSPAALEVAVQAAVAAAAAKSSAVPPTPRTASPQRALASTEPGHQGGHMTPTAATSEPTPEPVVSLESSDPEIEIQIDTAPESVPEPEQKPVPRSGSRKSRR